MTGCPSPVGKIGIDVSANPDRLYAVVEADPKGGLYRSDDGAKIVAAGERGVGAAHARLVLHEGGRRPEERRTSVWVLNADVSRSIDGGKIDHQRAHAARRQPQPVDQPERSRDAHRRQRRRRQRVLQRRPHLVHAGQPADGAVLPRERRQPVPLQRLRRPAGQHLGEDRQRRARRHHRARTGTTSAAARARCRPSTRTSRATSMPAATWASSASSTTRPRTARDIMAWPQMPAAVPPRDQKYRFNWSAPIVVSQLQPVGDLSRRQRAAALRQSRQDLARGQPRPDPQRQEQAGPRRRAHHQRRGRRRDLRRDRRHRRVAARRRHDLGRHRRWPRAADARRRQDLEQRDAAGCRRGDGERHRGVAACAGDGLRDPLEVQVQRLRAARLQDHRLRRDLDAHRRGHRARGVGARRA